MIRWIVLLLLLAIGPARAQFSPFVQGPAGTTVVNCLLLTGTTTNCLLLTGTTNALIL